MAKAIPGPKAKPLVGHLLDLMDEEAPLRAIEHMAVEYGPIYKYTRGGNRIIVVSSVEIMEELGDESRFEKAPPMALGKEDEWPAGLFTAANDDPDWGQAHRILVPAFGPLAIEGMYDQMQDISTQLLLKWARLGSTEPISVTDDFTRLTLDTIALCAMDFRFNSFYSNKMHPFVDAMVGFLSESDDRARRPEFLTNLMWKKKTKFNQDQDFMIDVSKDLVQHRKENPTVKKDLLNAMLSGKDPQTKDEMRDDLIIENMITFLVADALWTEGPVRVEHLNKLEYLNGVLRETLRLTPTAPTITKRLVKGVTGVKATLCREQYQIEPTDSILVILGAMQQDPQVYGADANEFKPEPMMGDNFKNLPGAAWKPFGSGVRSCIGRAFAWQEALMITAMLLQNFDFRLHDPGYKLRIKQSLTIKPKNLIMRATLRHQMTAMDLEHLLRGPPSSSLNSVDSSLAPAAEVPDISSLNLDCKPMTILYGSNTGTCLAFAQRMASTASGHGFKAKVLEMDSVVGELPTSQPIVIITASYEGNPPDNAARFFSWLEKSEPRTLSGKEFAVFGCGHSDWKSTYQKVPTIVDNRMAEFGSLRLVPRGLSDAAKGDLSGDFDDWSNKIFWPKVSRGSKSHGSIANAGMNIEISTQPGVTSLRQDVQDGVIVGSKVLTAPGTPEKRHLEIELPPDMIFESGDYLAVLPVNSNQNVRRVMKIFGLAWDSTIIIKGQRLGTLPLDTPLSIRDILAGYVELFEPVSKKVLQTMANSTTDETAKQSLTATSTDPTIYEREVLTKRLSIIALLEAYPSVKLPFHSFLSPSPPSASATTAFPPLRSLPPKPAPSPTTFYPSRLSPAPATMPESAAHIKGTPLLMFCAGTGIAPFRGFIQQRAIQAAASPDRNLAPAILFVGCRSSISDRLYAHEFDKWEYQGVVDMPSSFSRESDPDTVPYVNGNGKTPSGKRDRQREECKYVQERMMKEKDKRDILKLWDEGARVYACGAGAFVKEVGKAAREIVRERLVWGEDGDMTGEGEGMEEKGMEEREEREERLDRAFEMALVDRCATDIFGGYCI
ncbi:hypothetical protein SBOR_3317 [Sclerotinia borealis F-4128]|uniref:Bifunctional cytochrome P450/NADPH--P450 reductase n=1 Tax=Sclerotinia borealis (strain F-4128) TaxID=1432307 RepID=W9CHM5_SCLBF|nr:hypothetical protein SBOR_3317 [Sclerotinia borealis F-4128]